MVRRLQTHLLELNKSLMAQLILLLSLCSPSPLTHLLTGKRRTAIRSCADLLDIRQTLLSIHYWTTSDPSGGRQASAFREYGAPLTAIWTVLWRRTSDQPFQSSNASSNCVKRVTRLASKRRLLNYHFALFVPLIDSNLLRPIIVNHCL